MRTLRWVMTVFVFVAALAVTRRAEAVAFKLKNDTSHTVRSRVLDRGAWRDWVSFGPGGWGDFAKKVKRAEHDVEIDIWADGAWRPLYRNHHGSRLFTRIVQVVEQLGYISFQWWDEPPDCRDAPPPPGTPNTTCLRSSGTLIRLPIPSSWRIFASPAAPPGCTGTSNPLGFGPPCCDVGTIIQPGRGSCGRHSNLSPRLDGRGRYMGDSDRPNALPVRSGTLQVCAAYIIDNGEGDDWPHGPYGNLYWDVFRSDEPVLASADRADERRLQGPHVLRGPHRTHGDIDEWLDDELLTYHRFGLFRWGSHDAAHDELVLRLWESDSMSEDGDFWGRRNDVLGMELVDRAETEKAAVWVPFHAYTNEHPRRRTERIAVWMLLKTGGTCP